MVNYRRKLRKPERSASDDDEQMTWKLCLPWLNVWRESNKAIPTCDSGDAWSDLRNLDRRRLSGWRTREQQRRFKAGLPPLPEIDIDPNYPPIGYDSPESSPAPSSASPPSPPTSPLPDGLALPARTQGESVAQGPAASSHSMVTRSARQKAAPLPSTKPRISKRRMYARIPGAKQKKSTGSRGAKATTKPATGSSAPQVSNAQVHPADADGVAHPPAVVGPTSFGPMGFGAMNFGAMGFGPMPQDSASFEAYATMFPWCFPYGPAAHPAMPQTFAPQTSAPFPQASTSSVPVPRASTSNAPQPASFGSFNSTGPFHSSLYNFDFPEFNFDFLEDDVPGSEVVNPDAPAVAPGAAAGGSTHARLGPNRPIDGDSNV